MTEHGYRIAGPNREVYLRAVAYPKTDNEAGRLTEVQFPVEKV